MATSSRLCSDEELQKARDDLKELVARRRIRDRFKDPGHVEEEEGREKKDKVGKKKKLYVMTKEQVEMILNIQCGTFHNNKTIHKVAQEDEEMYGDLRTLVTVAGVLTKKCHDIVRTAQEELRHEVETKGYYVYEATDDEADNDNESAMTSQQGPRGKGSRRHQPGIVKHARGVK